MITKMVIKDKSAESWMPLSLLSDGGKKYAVSALFKPSKCLF